MGKIKITCSICHKKAIHEWYMMDHITLETFTHCPHCGYMEEYLTGVTHWEIGDAQGDIGYSATEEERCHNRYAYYLATRKRQKELGIEEPLGFWIMPRVALYG